MLYVMLSRRIILLPVASLCFQVMAIGQASTKAEEQRVECEDCLSAKDYLMALIKWRAELVEKHWETLRGNELFFS